VVRAGHAGRTATAIYAWGSPQNPISDADLERKFLHLAGPVVGDDRARALAEIAWNLDSVKDVDLALGQVFDVQAMA
jgi:hypothetical protein